MKNELIDPSKYSLHHTDISLLQITDNSIVIHYFELNEVSGLSIQPLTITRPIGEKLETFQQATTFCFFWDLTITLVMRLKKMLLGIKSSKKLLHQNVKNNPKPHTHMHIKIIICVMNRKLITSALPYVNNIPHGNLIQVLSADVFARFCRSRGYDTMYVRYRRVWNSNRNWSTGGGKTPRELCDYYHNIHKDIYQWFDIAFDHFGRTSTPQQTEIVRNVFLDLDKHGFIKENTIEQLCCEDCKRFLADRYVRELPSLRL